MDPSKEQTDKIIELREIIKRREAVINILEKYLLSQCRKTQALEYRLESIGAFRSPRNIGRSQEMPDLKQLTERGAKSWSTFDKNQKSWNVQSPTEADAQMKSAFEAKYQRDWNDPAGDEMKAVWADAWAAAICALTSSPP